jgi:hypothetical protein
LAAARYPRRYPGRRESTSSARLPDRKSPASGRHTGIANISIWRRRRWALVGGSIGRLPVSRPSRLCPGAPGRGSPEGMEIIRRRAAPMGCRGQSLCAPEAAVPPGRRAPRTPGISRGPMPRDPPRAVSPGLRPRV